VRSGRVAIIGSGEDSLEWVTLTLYLRGEQIQLFQLSESSPPPAPEPVVAEQRSRAAAAAEEGDAATAVPLYDSLLAATPDDEAARQGREQAVASARQEELRRIGPTAADPHGLTESARKTTAKQSHLRAPTADSELPEPAQPPSRFPGTGDQPGQTAAGTEASPPARKRNIRLIPLVLIAGAVFVLAGGIVAAIFVDRGGEQAPNGSRPTASSQPAASSPESDPTAYRQLMSHLPPELQSCSPSPLSYASKAEVAETKYCSGGLFFAMFESDSAARSFVQGSKGSGSCAVAPLVGKGFYETWNDGKRSGVISCSTSDDGAMAVEWTYEGLPIVGFVYYEKPPSGSTDYSNLLKEALAVRGKVT
jgi:hypothetical protein